MASDQFTDLFSGVGDFFSGLFNAPGVAAADTTEWNPWDRDGPEPIKPIPVRPAQGSVRQYLRQTVGPRIAGPTSVNVDRPVTAAPATRQPTTFNETDAGTSSPEERAAKLAWVAAAESMIGTREMPGEDHNEKVVDLWASGKAGDVFDDETPWCAAFVSDRLETSGVKSARTGWARGYLNWGQEADGPAVGSVVVFERGPKYGHVGFVVGKDKRGNLMVLGGNQGNAVSVAPFPTSRVLGYRWPEGQPLPPKTGMASLPTLKSGRRLSRNEQ